MKTRAATARRRAPPIPKGILEALDALAVVDLPVVGLAKARAGQVAEKARERVFLPGRGDPVVLRPDAPETLLIARIRDEAHRFAIRYHRKVRSQLAMSSVMDRIEGVGEVWRRRLLPALELWIEDENDAG